MKKSVILALILSSSISFAKSESLSCDLKIGGAKTKVQMTLNLAEGLAKLDSQGDAEGINGQVKQIAANTQLATALQNAAVGDFPKEQMDLLAEITEGIRGGSGLVFDFGDVPEFGTLKDGKITIVNIKHAVFKSGKCL